MNILYITKLVNSKSNGVTTAVLQLLNSISEKANVYWLDISDNEFCTSEKVKRINNIEEIKEKIDIALFEDPFNSIKFCSIANKLYKKHIPYILVPHGSFHKQAMKKKRWKKYFAIKTIFYKYLKRCIGVQYLTSNEMMNSLHFNNSYIVPNGIYQNNFNINKCEIKNFVYIGRKDVNVKGLDLLIKACFLIKKDMIKNNCKMNIYGPKFNDKNEREIDCLIDEYKLNDIVFNNNALYDNEKKNVLINSDVFIQTSRHEGLPMSILEALSYCLPVIVSKETNVADIVSNAKAGWECEVDAEDIAKKIKEAIYCKNIHIISKNAKNLSQNYSWEEINNHTLELYNKIIRE